MSQESNRTLSRRTRSRPRLVRTTGTSPDLDGIAISLRPTGQIQTTRLSLPLNRIPRKRPHLVRIPTRASPYLHLRPIRRGAVGHIQTLVAKDLEGSSRDGPLLGSRSSAVFDFHHGAVCVGCRCDAFRGVGGGVDVGRCGGRGSWGRAGRRSTGRRPGRRGEDGRAGFASDGAAAYIARVGGAITCPSRSLLLSDSDRLVWLDSKALSHRDEVVSFALE